MWQAPLVSDTLNDKVNFFFAKRSMVYFYLSHIHLGRNYPLPIVYWSDTCCSGKGFWDEVFERFTEITGISTRLSVSPSSLSHVANLNSLPSHVLPNQKNPVYLTRHADVLVVVELLKDNARQEKINGRCVIGLDIEYKPFSAGIPATLQLCSIDGTNILLHFAAMEGQSLRIIQNFLQDKEFIFVGVGIKSDVKKLVHRDIHVKEFMDCASKAKDFLLIPQNRVAGTASLAGLTSHLLKKSLPKDPRVRMSNWDNKNLSNEQIRYAILDAYAGVALFKFIMQHENW
jgi:hypothetical protein